MLAKSNLRLIMSGNVDLAKDDSHHFPFFGSQVFEFEEDKVGDCFGNVGILMGRGFKELFYRWG